MKLITEEIQNVEYIIEESKDGKKNYSIKKYQKNIYNGQNIMEFGKFSNSNANVLSPFSKNSKLG